jgi:hypothetical protein
MRITLTALFFCSIAFFASAQGGKADKATDLWDQLLQKHVTPGGMVDYTAIKSERDFKKVLDGFAAQAPNQSWSIEAKLAYWINTYNAFTVKLVTDHWPLKSIKEVEGAWALEFIEIEGKRYSLDAIEHEVIRKQFNEPRIHFALNCASYSCPVLLNRAYRETQLEEQLDRQTRDFLNDIHRNRISGKLAQVSQLFEWFAEDFESEGGVRAFIGKYRGKEIPERVQLSYIPYDWKLNAQQ